MGNRFSDYARRKAKEKLQQSTELYTQLSGQMQSSADTVASYDEDKGTVTLPDGSTRVAHKIGDPAPTEGTLLAGNEAIQPSPNILHTATVNASDPLLLLKNVTNDYFVKNLQLETLYTLDVSGPGTLATVQFSPSGNHILVGHYTLSGGTHGSIQLDWKVYKFYELRTVDGVPTVYVPPERLITGTYLISGDDVATDLTPDAPTSVPPASSCNQSSSFDSTQNCGEIATLHHEASFIDTVSFTSLGADEAHGRPATDMSTTMEGSYCFSNDEHDQFRVDFIGDVIRSSTKYAYYAWTGETAESHTSDDSVNCCAFVPIVGLRGTCTQDSTIDASISYTSLPGGLVTRTKTLTKTIARGGCVSGGSCPGFGDAGSLCGGTPFGVNTCGSLTTVASGSTTLSVASPGQLDFGNTIAIPNNVNAGSSGAFTLAVWKFQSTIEGQNKFQILDLQSDTPSLSIFGRGYGGIVFEESSADKLQSNATTGTNVNGPYTCNYTSSFLDVGSIGNIQSPSLLFRSLAGVPAALWFKVDPDGSIWNYFTSAGNPDPSYILDGVTDYFGTRPVVVTDTHAFMLSDFMAEWGDSASVKAIDSEEFIDLKQLAGGLGEDPSIKLTQRRAFSDISTILLLEQDASGPTVPGYSIIDYTFTS